MLSKFSSSSTPKDVPQGIPTNVEPRCRLLFRLLMLCTLMLSSDRSILLAQSEAEAKQDPQASIEAGFQGIFDGKSLAGWQGKEGFWKVVDGAIVGETTTENPLKDNTFLVWEGGDVENFELRFQFRITGEQANSGVQFRCVADETGHLIGYQADIDRAGQWLGIIYDEKTGRNALCDRGQQVVIDAEGNRTETKVADKAKLFEQVDLDQWTDYVIRAQGDRLTIKVGGNVTADLVDREEGHADAKGVLGLQLHTGPPMKIEFRNLRMKQLDAAAAKDDEPTADDDENGVGYRAIFDGKSLDGWVGDEKLWRVEDGVIVGETVEGTGLKQNEFLVWDQGEVDDFSLRLKFKISGTKRANSGVQFRSQRIEGTQTRLKGYQADIDRSGQYIGITYSERTGRGILCQRGQKVTLVDGAAPQAQQVADAAELLSKIDLEDWNEMEVFAEGNRSVVKINGNVTSEVIDEDASKAIRKGLIGLQLHVGPPMKIEFKDIELKRLPLADGLKKVVFIAGKPSHGYGAHEHNAGCLLLANNLDVAAVEQQLPVLTTVYRNGWPSDPTALDNANTIVVYCDGGGRHFLHRNGEAMDAILRRGIGLACIHYGVEVPKGVSGQRFLQWIGGYFETDWSVNPHWLAKFESLPEHPITRGVAPFEVQDEWYYHMRFSPEMTRVTPLLTALPPADSLSRKDGPHSGNPAVRKAVLEEQRPQHLAWAFVRGDGVGRGFGFTGGHFHRNWQNDDFRKLVLNAITWTAHADVPADGVQSATPSEQELASNQDFPKPQK